MLLSGGQPASGVGLAAGGVRPAAGDRLPNSLTGFGRRVCVRACARARVRVLVLVGAAAAAAAAAVIVVVAI